MPASGVLAHLTEAAARRDWRRDWRNIPLLVSFCQRDSRSQETTTLGRQRTLAPQAAIQIQSPISCFISHPMYQYPRESLSPSPPGPAITQMLRNCCWVWGRVL
jgi:hypothetical protein